MAKIGDDHLCMYVYVCANDLLLLLLFLLTINKSTNGCDDFFQALDQPLILESPFYGGAIQRLLCVAAIGVGAKSESEPLFLLPMLLCVCVFPLFLEFLASF